MQRSVVLALVALLAFSSVPAVAVPDARLTVTDVTVSPGTPVTGSPVTVDVTVANAAGSPSAVTVDRVALETVTGDTVVQATRPGALSPGGSLSVPLTDTFERPGERRLLVIVEGTDEENDRVRVQRPLVFTVEQAPPLVEVRPGTAVTDAEMLTEVVVSNPTVEPVRNLVVRFDQTAARVDVERRTVPALAAGASVTLNFTAVPTEAGEQEVGAEVSYTSATGTRGTTDQVGRVAVEELVDDVGVRASRVVEAESEQVDVGGQLGVLLGGGSDATRQDESGAPPERVAVTVTNFGNVPVERVVVAPRAGDVALPRLSLADPLAPGDEATVTVDLDAVADPGDVTFDVTYRVGTREGSARGAFDYRPKVGAVSVTGVSLAVDDDGGLQLSGNLGNTGEAPVNGVVVSMGESEHVRPAYPQRDYFVGTVDASEFAPFDLTADVDAANATAVPVVVRYSADGVERVETVELPFDDSVTPDGERSERFPWPLALGVLGVVAVPLAVLVVARRR